MVLPCIKIRESAEKTCHVVALWYPTVNLFEGSELRVFSKKTCKTLNYCAVINKVKVLDLEAIVKWLICNNPNQTYKNKASKL